MVFYIGAGKRISAEDFADIAQKNDIDYAALRAVCEIEARNYGFTSANALICLYEPHIAYKYTSGTKRAALIKAGLAYAKQGEKPYPKTSYPNIDKCAAIAGEEVAALSTSWGLPQMMGFNHNACGYSTALDMVKAFAASEYNQVEAMVQFIKATPAMYTAMKKRDWATFAKYYNGPAYAKNNYDNKLAVAYAKWLKNAPPAKEIPVAQMVEVEAPAPAKAVENFSSVNTTSKDIPDTPSVALKTILGLIANVFSNIFKSPKG